MQSNELVNIVERNANPELDTQAVVNKKNL
jgi:hypothetical protein